MTYYRRGMSEDEQRAISKTLSQTERDALLAKGLAALPACWTQELDDCANLLVASSKFDCAALADGWTGDYDKMEAAFVALPKCPPPAPKGMGNTEKGLLAGGLALLLFAVVRVAVRRTKAIP